MRAWFFSENAYHLLPDPKEYDSIRVKLTNRYYDPKSGAHPFTWIGGFYAARAKTQVYDNEPVFGITQVFQQHGLDVNDPNDLDAGANDPAFYRAKITSARFFADHFLSQAAGLAEITMHGAAGVMALAEEQF